MKKAIDFTDAEVAIAVSALSEYESKIGSSNMSKDITIPVEFIRKTATDLKERFQELQGLPKKESYYASRKRQLGTTMDTATKRGRKKKEVNSSSDTSTSNITKSSNGRRKEGTKSSIPVDKVRQYLVDGLTPTEISKVENVTLRTTHRWINKVKSENPDFSYKAKRGRKPSIEKSNEISNKDRRGKRPRIKKESSSVASVADSNTNQPKKRGRKPKSKEATA
jgi:hypothetical protein